MNLIIKSKKTHFWQGALLLVFCFFLQPLFSQTETTKDTNSIETESKQVKKPVKNTFESIWIIDNQTVLVPKKKSFEMDILHRFGTVKNGYEDFFGLFANSNIRLGFNYVPIDNLNVSIGITKEKMLVDGSLKYAILKQTKGSGGIPVSISFYTNLAVDTRDESNFIYNSERLIFFNQLLIARKISEKFSVQVAPSISHQNSVYGYYKYPTDSTSEIAGEMKHNHFAIAVSGRWKFKEGLSLIVNYDQPITKHDTNNPNPNISFGIEMTTSSHVFQVFAGNFYNLSPQRNNLYNHNDYTDGQFLIGFNITRLWNY